MLWSTIKQAFNKSVLSFEPLKALKTDKINCLQNFLSLTQNDLAKKLDKEMFVRKFYSNNKK